MCDGFHERIGFPWGQARTVIPKILEGENFIFVVEYLLMDVLGEKSSFSAGALGPGLGRLKNLSDQG